MNALYCGFSKSQALQLISSFVRQVTLNWMVKLNWLYETRWQHGAEKSHKLSTLFINPQEVIMIALNLTETETSHRKLLTARPNQQGWLLNLTPHNLIISLVENVYSPELCLILSIPVRFKTKLGCAVKIQNHCMSVACSLIFGEIENQSINQHLLI